MAINKPSSYKSIKAILKRCGSGKKAALLQRFFKTGPGEYAEGDVFIGINVPVLRALSKKYQDLPFNEALQLLRSRIHEERLLALLILILKYRKAGPQEKEKIYKAYLNNSKYINNWDLVDVTAKHIVGEHLREKDKRPIYNLAGSRDLWEKRIAILATFNFIEHGQFKDTLRIAGILIDDKHDLIHKAVGWMLREVGKRDMRTEERFLDKYHGRMPRTMLRYAIEKFPENKRKKYLKKK